MKNPVHFILRFGIIIFMFAFILPDNVKGQVILSSNYTFSQFSQTYVPITGGTVRGTSLNDNQIFSNVPIGFFIAYNGASYNSLGISSNGFIWFGATAPAGSNYTPISSTTASAAYICAFAKNLESRSATGGGELRTRLSGTAPHRIFTIQWKNYQRFSSGTADNGDIFNFQIRLFEYNQSVEIVYGAMTTNVTSTAQVGMRGHANTNFMNRVVNSTNLWNNSVSGTVNTSTVSYSPTRVPASGQTYRWIPTSLVNSSLSGGAIDTVTNGMTDLQAGSTALTASFTEEGGITSLGIQRFVNGISQPWVAMNKLSGNDTTGVWQVTLPDVNVNADVVYLFRIINPSGFFMYSEIIAYEVGYLRTYAPDDFVVPDNLQGSGISLSAEASVSAVKITEVVFDRLAPGGNSTTPSYVPSSDVDLIELTNLSPDDVRLDGMILRVTSAGNGHELEFPSGTILPGGGRATIQAGGSAGQVITGIADELYFETGGVSNTLHSDTPSGIALYNKYNDVLDAVAFNGYTFTDQPAVRIVHWYGAIASSIGKAGARRTTMTDHNTSTDWEFLDVNIMAQPGTMNPGLAAISESPSFSWSSDDIPGWVPSGSDVQLPILNNGTYLIKNKCTDNGYMVYDNLTVIVYTPMIPVADFTASETSVYPNHTISLIDLSSDYPDNYDWNITPGSFTLMEGTSLTSKLPRISFNLPGSYSITLTVTNELGNTSVTKTDYINVVPFLGVCIKPDQLTISGVTNTSATVSWSEGFVADSMQVRYAKSTGGGGGNQFFTTSSVAVLSGLTPATNYNVRVRPWCNGVATDGYTSKTFFTTGGARLALESVDEMDFSATIFPNPATNDFQLQFYSQEQRMMALSISDLTGKIIAVEKFVATEGKSHYKPATLLTPGVYVVKVIADDSEQVMRLVIL